MFLVEKCYLYSVYMIIYEYKLHRIYHSHKKAVNLCYVVSNHCLMLCTVQKKTGQAFFIPNSGTMCLCHAQIASPYMVRCCISSMAMSHQLKVYTICISNYGLVEGYMQKYISEGQTLSIFSFVKTNARYASSASISYPARKYQPKTCTLFIFFVYYLCQLWWVWLADARYSLQPAN